VEIRKAFNQGFFDICKSGCHEACPADYLPVIATYDAVRTGIELIKDLPLS
jgi:hypothetical protein